MLKEGEVWRSTAEQREGAYWEGAVGGLTAEEKVGGVGEGAVPRGTAEQREETGVCGGRGQGGWGRKCWTEI